jgi:peptidyl-prolyl cis-trans isomerase SurA
MKYTFAFLLVFCLYGSLNAQLIDKIVAQVGDEIILLSNIQAAKLQQVQERNLEVKDINTLSDCKIIEDLMYQNLLLNQARLDSLPVSDEQVDSEMENRLRYIISSMPGGRDQFEKFYGKSITQIKEDFRIIIRNQILARDMQQKLTSSVSVTPKEVEAYFKNLPKDSIPYINMKLSFQQIAYFPAITQEDKNKVYNDLRDIRSKILAGDKSFEFFARTKSEDPGSAAQGGKIAASKGMMVPAFEAAVFSLKPGEISEVFESEYGYHVLKLNSRLGEDYTCQHILLTVKSSEESLNDAAAKIDSCYSLLLDNKITWDEAVLRFSNDENTKQNKGIITNPRTGEQTWDMQDLNEIDREIYVLTDALEESKFTQPNIYFDVMARKQGFRIVRLMKRFPPHIANLTDDYMLIKRAAENDKMQKTLEKWVESKVNNVYIRLDDSLKNCDFNYKWTTQTN